MKRLIIISIISLIFGHVAIAQHGLSMYHLKNATFQNTHFNAAYIPEYGSFFLGLPVISGINIHVSSKLSYNEVITNTAEGNFVDVNKAISNLTRQNGIYGHFNFNLLHLGKRLKNGGVVSFFANERFEFDFLFPKEVAQFLWQGNATLLEEEVDFGRFALSANYFREIGLGYAYEVPDYGMKVGVRLKYLQGLVNVNTPGNAKANILTENENNQINVEFENARVRTASVEIATGDQGDIGSHLIANPNSGYGLDLGVEYRYNRFYAFALGINDLGFINWKENIKDYSVPDTVFRYRGSDLTRIRLDNIEDSLDNFINVLEYDKNNGDPYTTMLPARIFGSVIWSGYPGVEVISTVATRIIQGQPRFSFGVGGRYTTGSGLTISGNVTKLDQQFFNIGAAIAAKVSVLQVYLASDHLVGYSAPDLDAIDIRLGINFIFSSRNKSSKNGPGGRGGYGSISDSRNRGKGNKGPKYGYFLGEEVKVKGKDDIYDVIKKQKRREPADQSEEPKFDKKSEEFDTSEKPKFKDTSGSFETSEKPKFKKKPAINSSSSKPKFGRRATNNSSSPKPKFGKKSTNNSSSPKPAFKKKKTSNQSSAKPKFKKKKRKN